MLLRIRVYVFTKGGLSVCFYLFVCMFSQRVVSLCVRVTHLVINIQVLYDIQNLQKKLAFSDRKKSSQICRKEFALLTVNSSF